MGYINETIKTTLHYKDIALIAVAFGLYQEKYKKTASKDVLLRMDRLVNRLGEEISNNPNND